MDECFIAKCDGFVAKNDAGWVMLHCFKNIYGWIDKANRLGPAMWPHFDLVFVHDGQLRLVFKDHVQKQISAGQALLIYPETPFWGKPTTEVAKISVHHFSVNESEPLHATVNWFYGERKGCKRCIPLNREIIEQDMARIIKLTEEPASALNTELRSLLMAVIMAQLRSAQVGGDTEPSISPDFQQLTEWLRKHLSRDITLDVMAEQVGYSVSHFRAVFKQQLGISPGSYLLNLRVAEASKLLRETALPIKKIAAQTGYNDLSRFYHEFKVSFNTTPKQYRSQYLPLG